MRTKDAAKSDPADEWKWLLLLHTRHSIFWDGNFVMLVSFTSHTWRSDGSHLRRRQSAKQALMLNYVFIRMRKVSRIFLSIQLSGDKFFHHESKTGGELWLCFLFSTPKPPTSQPPYKWRREKGISWKNFAQPSFTVKDYFIQLTNIWRRARILKPVSLMIQRQHTHTSIISARETSRTSDEWIGGNLFSRLWSRWIISFLIALVFGLTRVSKAKRGQIVT